MTNLIKQLEQDLQNELTTSNQLLRLISLEIQHIKEFTNPGGEFEANIKQNATVVSDLAKIQQIDIKSLPPAPRPRLDDSRDHTGQNSREHRNSIRECSQMDDTQ